MGRIATMMRAKRILAMLLVVATFLAGGPYGSALPAAPAPRRRRFRKHRAAVRPILRWRASPLPAQ